MSGFGGRRLESPSGKWTRLQRWSRSGVGKRKAGALIEIWLMRMGIFAFHFYCSLWRTKGQHQPSIASKVWANKQEFQKWFPDFPRGVWVRQGQKLECSYKCLQISRVCFCNCKPQCLLKRPLQPLLWWLLKNCCLMSHLCIMGFVWKDSNRTEESVMQLLTGCTRM